MTNVDLIIYSGALCTLVIAIIVIVISRSSK